MSPNQDNKDNLEYVFTRIFDNLDRIVERADKTDESNNRAFEEIKEDIKLAKEESKKLLDHAEILITLSQNLSAEGLKELIADVQDSKTYIIAHRASELAKAELGKEVKSDDRRRKDLFVKIASGILAALLMALGWLLKSYITVSPHTPQ